VLSALHTISSYPFDLGSPIFAHYPAMKFGHLASVNYFAELLAPMALQAIGDGPAKDRGWVLTSPSLRGLPCGANLVCRALCDRLAKALPDGQAPRLDSMEARGARTPISSLAEFEAYDGYSKQDLKQRQQFSLPFEKNLTYDLANFEDRHAIFVNDINVTGTQLATITKLLQSAGVKSLDVLLIVNVDCKIGCAFPQLESEINTSRITDLAEFIAFLRDCEFDPTGKLICRLMSYDLREFAAIFEALQPPKRQTLRRAILQEGLYGGPLFREKIEAAERAVFGDGRAIL
jgi:PRTase ComF-like